ncbi:MAG: hypothetical protein ACYC1D_01765 [Acidimicrobiales bacterium]
MPWRVARRERQLTVLINGVAPGYGLVRRSSRFFFFFFLVILDGMVSLVSIGRHLVFRIRQATPPRFCFDAFYPALRLPSLRVRHPGGGESASA